MSFIFTMRSTPRAARSRANSSPLPIITEDGGSPVEQTPRVAPPLPTRASNRPAHKAFGFRPPRHNYDSPPAYSHFSLDEPEENRPNAEKLAEARKALENNKHIARRGGWKRLCILAAIVVLCIVGIVVGIIIGLRDRASTSHPTSNSNGGASGNVENGPANPASSTAFPAGSYSFPTFLSTIRSNCSSNPATWRCYPYTTYSSSQSASSATFQWIINPVPSTNKKASWNYTISSTDNVFSTLFTNVSLSLVNQGQSDEHYFFQTSTAKLTKPVTQLGTQNVASTCYFNQTMFQGYLYTKMEKTYPNSGNSTNTGSETVFGDWPHAVKIEQFSNAGKGTPTCLDPQGKSLGDFSVADTAEECECLYLNTGT